MVKKAVWTTAVFLLVTGTLYAQDITGDWQGTLTTNAGVRLIVRPSQSCALPPAPPRANPTTAAAAIQAGTQRHTDIKPPVLAIYAAEGPRTEACATAFEKVVPSSRIVRVPGATHYVFGSNEAEVLKETRDFIGGLKK